MTYAIIDREEFISLYKYGEIIFQPNRIVKASNDKDAEMVLLSKLKELPLCDYEEDYLIISLDETITASSNLDINHIIELIPLSSRSQKGYERKFEDELKFSKPRFESILEEYFEYVNLIEHKNGAKALARACNCALDGSSFISDDDFIEAFRRKNNGERSHSFQGEFLTHLLVYDRYDFFPNSDLGYLYDLGTILANSKGKRSFSGSAFHGFLEKNRDRFDNLSLRYIFQEIDNSQELEGLRSSLTSRDGIRLYIAAAIYLKYKNELRNSKSVAETSLGMVLGKKRAEHKFIDEFDLAIYLTGLFFGFQEFNKEIYRVSNLRILKDYSPPVKIDKDKVDSGASPLKSKDKPEMTEESIKVKDDVKSEVEDEKNQPVLEITNEEMLTTSDGKAGDEIVETAKVKKKDHQEDKESRKEAKNDKNEEIIIQIESVVSKIGKDTIKISQITKELGRYQVKQIEKVIENDSKNRFELVKIGRASALRKKVPGLFDIK